MRLNIQIKPSVKSGISVFLVLLAVACQTKSRNEIDRYFDIPGFIDEQVSLLSGHQVQMSKTVSFGNKTESIMVKDPDSALWQQELRIFKEHDINKPVLVDAYQPEERSITGKKIVVYKLKDSAKAGILDMEIVYDTTGQVSTWTSSFLEQNLLYCNFREVKLTTGRDGMLNGYLVDGFHKLMFKDTVFYQLRVEIDNL